MKTRTIATTSLEKFKGELDSVDFSPDFAMLFVSEEMHNKSKNFFRY